ncbi:kinase-like domain-containing protein [Amylostereum chailletii]|nr:kinase-like domain-containing protein [Amylostereum chailletii]
MKELVEEESLCDLLAVFQDSNYVYLVTKLYSCALKHLGVHLTLKKAGLPMSARDARFYVAELITGLERLNARGINHTNLTPDNVLVSPNGHLVFTGFDGFSKDEKDRDTTLYEMERDFRLGPMISFSHCPPEFYNPPYGYDKRKLDLWSLGVTLLEFCLGMSSPYFFHKESPRKKGWPLESKSALADPRHYMGRKLKGWEFTKQKALKSLLDPQVWDFLKGLLEKDPERRTSLEQAKKHPLLKDSIESEGSSLVRQGRIAEPPYAPAGLRHKILCGDIRYTQEPALTVREIRPLPSNQLWQTFDSWSAPPEILSEDATRKHGNIMLYRRESAAKPHVPDMLEQGYPTTRTMDSGRE